MADWVAAIGTVGTLAVALALMAVDRRDHDREQADRVVLWLTFPVIVPKEGGEPTFKTNVMIRNGSDQPIMNVVVLYRARSRLSLLVQPPLGRVRGRLDPSTTPCGQIVVFGSEHSITPPGATVSVPIPLSTGQILVSRVIVCFNDARGRRRVKEALHGGPSRYGSARSELRDRIYISRNNGKTDFHSSEFQTRRPSDPTERPPT